MSTRKRQPSIMDLPEDYAYRLAEAVCAIRKRSGLSQEQFAKRIGSAPNSILYWETGARPPCVVYLIKMHLEFGGEWSELLGE